MRNTFRWRWLVVIASVGIVCLPGRAVAQRHEHPEAEHRGSIHHGGPESHRDFHSERRGSIRYEHDERPWSRAPFLVAPHYEREYFRRFRPGYRTIVIGPGTFYYYPVLPTGCGTVAVGGQYYYFCDGVYYLPYLYQGTTIYVAVPPPA
jgi:hypothetical protein